MRDPAPVKPPRPPPRARAAHLPLLRRALLLAWLLAGAASAFEWRTGDLVYIALPGAAGGAISDSSGSIASHIGIASVHPDGSVHVLHAYGRVREDPLERYLAKGTGPYAVNRLADAPPSFGARLVAGARAFLGWPYDRKYRIDNRALYCSELVYRALLDGTAREPVPLSPMDFQPEDPETWAFWWRFFQGDVPQGEPGIAPGDYLESPAFELVHDELRATPRPGGPGGELGPAASP